MHPVLVQGFEPTTTIQGLPALTTIVWYPQDILKHQAKKYLNVFIPEPEFVSPRDFWGTPSRWPRFVSASAWSRPSSKRLGRTKNLRREGRTSWCTSPPGRVSPERWRRLSSMNFHQVATTFKRILTSFYIARDILFCHKSNDGMEHVVYTPSGKRRKSFNESNLWGYCFNSVHLDHLTSRPSLSIASF